MQISEDERVRTGHLLNSRFQEMAWIVSFARRCATSRSITLAASPSMVQPETGMPASYGEPQQQWVAEATGLMSDLFEEKRAQLRTLIDGLNGDGPLVRDARITGETSTYRDDWTPIHLYDDESTDRRAQSTVRSFLIQTPSAHRQMYGVECPLDQPVTLPDGSTESFLGLAEKSLGAAAETRIRFLLGLASADDAAIADRPYAGWILDAAQQAGVDCQALRQALSAAPGSNDAAVKELSGVLAELSQVEYAPVYADHTGPWAEGTCERVAEKVQGKLTANVTSATKAYGPEDPGTTDGREGPSGPSPRDPVTPTPSSPSTPGGRSLPQASPATVKVASESVAPSTNDEADDKDTNANEGQFGGFPGGALAITPAPPSAQPARSATRQRPAALPSERMQRVQDALAGGQTRGDEEKPRVGRSTVAQEPAPTPLVRGRRPSFRQPVPPVVRNDRERLEVPRKAPADAPPGDTKGAQPAVGEHSEPDASVRLPAILPAPANRSAPSSKDAVEGRSAPGMTHGF
jgi:hypothetical protein